MFKNGCLLFQKCTKQRMYRSFERFLKIYAKNAELSEIRFDEDL